MVRSQHSDLGILFLHFPLVKLLILCIFIYLLGFIAGTCAYIVLRLTYNFCMKRFYGVYPLTKEDMTFVYNLPNEIYTCCAVMKFKSLDSSKFVSNFIEKGIKNFERLRSIRTIKNMEFWWKILSIKEATDGLVVRHITKEINTVSEINAIVSKEIHEPINVEKRLPYELIFIKNKSDFGDYLIFKFDHAFSDGLGIVSLLFALADNYSLTLFPFNKKYSWASYIINLVLIPYFFLKLMLSLMNFSKDKSPFKVENGKTKSCQNNLEIITDIKFEDMTKVYKKLGISFNDLVLSLISASVKKYVSESDEFKSCKTLSCTIPIGTRGFPKSIKELIITNKTTAISSNLTLIDDVITQSKQISNQFSQSIKDFGQIEVSNLIVLLLTSFLPYYVFSSVARSQGKQRDMLISNVPFAKTELVYNGDSCNQIIPYITPGGYTTFIAILTYNGKVSFLFSMADGLKIDSKILSKYFKEQLETTMSKIKV